MFSKSLSRLSIRPSSLSGARRTFANTAPNCAKNRLYTPIRNSEELSNYILLSASSRTPLITLWTTSWCSTCRTVSPILEELVRSGVGESDGGVSYAEIEYDAPDMMASELGLRYMVTKIPTLLSFDRSEARSRVMDGKKLVDREFLKEYIENEAKRRGTGGSGDGWASNGWASNGGLFGGMFGITK